MLRTGSIFASGIVALGPLLASAHTRPRPTPETAWAAWYVDPLIAIPMLLASWLYLRGVRNLWATSCRGTGISRKQAWAWIGAMVSLMAALFSPLDALGGALFSAHMVQHLILFVVAPWFLALSRPGIGMFWGLPAVWRKRTGGFLGHNRYMHGVQALLRNPVFIVATFTAVLWLWHTPALYDAALQSDWVHALEHMSFIAGACLLWSWLVTVQHNFGHRRGERHGLAILIVFVTVMQSSVLGAILTFARAPLYAMHEPYTRAWGLSLMQDQQLAGLIMWVPMGMTFTLFALLIFRAWLQASERRALAREPEPATAPRPAATEIHT